MAILYSNNASSTLAGAIVDDLQTTLIVAVGDGVLFPLPTGGDYFVIAVEDNTGTIELMKCTSRTSDTLTVERGFEGTTARPWTAGVRVELRLTAHQMEENVQLTGGTMTGALKGPEPSVPADYATKNYVDTSATIISGGVQDNLVIIDADEKPSDSGLNVATLSQAELDILDGATITTAQLNDIATITGTETLTNKTLTSPAITGSPTVQSKPLMTKVVLDDPILLFTSTTPSPVSTWSTANVQAAIDVIDPGQTVLASDIHFRAQVVTSATATGIAYTELIAKSPNCTLPETNGTLARVAARISDNVYGNVYETEDNNTETMNGSYFTYLKYGWGSVNYGVWNAWIIAYYV